MHMILTNVCSVDITAFTLEVNVTSPIPQARQFGMVLYHLLPQQPFEPDGERHEPGDPGNGTYDRVITWLCNQDDPTVKTVVSLLWRCRETGWH